MLAWIFWTGRRRLQREYCGQSSPSVMQLTILIGPSSARTTCPTVMSVRPPGQHVAALGPVVAGDEPVLGETLKDLRQELGRDMELLGDALGADRAVIPVGRRCSASP